MATIIPQGSNNEASPKQELCLPLDKAIDTLPECLKPTNEQEHSDLAMFLTQVDEVHGPIAGNLSASSVFNYLNYMLKSVTPNTKEGPSQITLTEQMTELTENIAFEIASNVVSDVDVHTTTISVLKVLQEVSWETKTALMTATFVLTFGDKGLNLCEKSKVSVNEIQMFVELKGGYKQQLEEKEVDIEAYNRIKEIVQQRNHSDNMEVLNALFPSVVEDAHQLYDCLHERKVHLTNLKGAYVSLFISDLQNIVPEVDKSILDDFINSYDAEGENRVECSIVWVPMIDNNSSLQRTKATGKSIVKPFLDFYYFVHQKFNQAIEFTYREKQKSFMNWYSIGEPSMISNEVKKLMRDDWMYKKGEPMMVVLDPKGNIVNYNAIHMFYFWGFKAFPFTSKREEHMLEMTDFDTCFRTIYYGVPVDMDQFPFYRFFYGGENAEWIRNMIGMMRDIERDLQCEIMMVYVGRSHNLELVQSINEEKLSPCLTDQYIVWLFWKRLESIIYLGAHTGRSYDSNDKVYLQRIQRLFNYDKSNAGWLYCYNFRTLFHGKVALATLKEFRLWKEEAGFFWAFISHYNKNYQKILPSECVEYPTSALKAPIETMSCPECDSEMQQYTTFICYHSQSRD